MIRVTPSDRSIRPFLLTWYNAPTTNKCVCVIRHIPTHPPKHTHAHAHAHAHAYGGTRAHERTREAPRNYAAKQQSSKAAKPRIRNVRQPSTEGAGACEKTLPQERTNAYSGASAAHQTRTRIRTKQHLTRNNPSTRTPLTRSTRTSLQVILIMSVTELPITTANNGIEATTPLTVTLKVVVPGYLILAERVPVRLGKEVVVFVYFGNVFHTYYEVRWTLKCQKFLANTR